MTLKEIRDNVKIIIADDSFEDAEIDGYINQVLQEIGTLVDLPDLKRLDVVSTVVNQAYVSLGSLEGGFSGRLRKVGDENVAVYPSLELMLVDYPDMDEEDGDVEAVCLEGSILWYQPYPTSSAYVDTIRIVYYTNPPSITTSADCTCIPAALHYSTLVRGTAALLYSIIEDGAEGDKVNTLAQTWHFDGANNNKSGIALLRAYIERNKKHYISSTWNN